MRIVIALILLLLIGSLVHWHAPVSSSTILSGTVTGVRDGDTLEVRNVPVRLQGLNCEEKHSPLGQAATLAITDMAAGFFVSCTLTGEKSYGREIGRCSLGDGSDLGAELIAQGLCGRCDRYDVGGAYIAVQRAAGPWRGAFPGYCRS